MIKPFIKKNWQKIYQNPWIWFHTLSIKTRPIQIFIKQFVNVTFKFSQSTKAINEWLLKIKWNEKKEEKFWTNFANNLNHFEM